MATENVLAAAYPEFELGAVAPLAAVHGGRVLVDIAVSEFVLIEAGTHEKSLRIRSSDLIRLNGAIVADLTTKILLVTVAGQPRERLPGLRVSSPVGRSLVVGGLVVRRGLVRAVVDRVLS